MTTARRKSCQGAKRTGVGSRAGIRIEAKRQAEPWREIERAAHEQVLADLKAAEAMPLAVESFVAWTVSQPGWQTDALSVLHRVGSAIGDQPMTMCSETIPAAVRRLPLGPGLIRTLDRCRWCEEAYARKGVYAA